MSKGKESSPAMVKLAQKMWRRKPARLSVVAAQDYNDLLADGQKLAGSVVAQADVPDEDDEG